MLILKALGCQLDSAPGCQAELQTCQASLGASTLREDRPGSTECGSFACMMVAETQGKQEGAPDPSKPVGSRSVLSGGQMTSVGSD